MSRAFTDSLRAVAVAASVAAIAACGMAPVKNHEGTPPTSKNSEEPQKKKIKVVVTSKDILPKQKYAMDGTKIPYEAMPNPYLLNPVAVAPVAKKQYQIADAYLKQGKLKEARKEFKSLTRNYPELSGPWVKIAEIAVQREEFSDAIDAYEKALEVNSNNVAAYLDLAKLYREQGHFAEARNTYLRALNSWPDFPEGHFNLAVFYDLYVNDALSAQKHFQAYYFLTGNRSEEVRKWLVELQRRTGDERNYVDTAPPKNPAIEKSASVVAEKS